MKSNIEMVIEKLIVATLGENASAREIHLYRESLRGLVRLAQAEKMLEMKTNVKKMTGPVTTDINLPFS